MIRVSVEVYGEAARFTTAVWAESIERALSLARTHYPSYKIRLIFPIEPENFFAASTRPLSEGIYPEAPE